MNCKAYTYNNMKMKVMDVDNAVKFFVANARRKYFYIYKTKFLFNSLWRQRYILVFL